jgi:hypothetical protein
VQKHWRKIHEDRRARRVAKAANAAAAIERRKTAADELVAVGTTQSAPPAANDEPMCCEPCPVDATPDTDPVAPKKAGIGGLPWYVFSFSALNGFFSPTLVLLPSRRCRKS